MSYVKHNLMSFSTV